MLSSTASSFFNNTKTIKLNYFKHFQKSVFSLKSNLIMALHSPITEISLLHSSSPTSPILTPSTFLLNKSDAIGYDMDHTLIRYKTLEFSILIYNCVRNYLVDIKNYPMYLKNIVYDNNYCSKGIIYDPTYGNFIKIDTDCYVIRAYHGTRRLNNEEISQLYPNKIDFNHETVDVNSRKTSYYKAYITAFDVPVVALIVHLIDLVDQDKLPCKNYEEMKRDIFEGFEHIFGDFNKGEYFSALRANPGGYLQLRPDVKEWLITLKQSKTLLFLITNSHLDYTNLLMNFVFGNEWTNLFDFVVTHASKPTFFTEERSFLSVDIESSKELTDVATLDSFDQNKPIIVCRGSWKEIHSAITFRSNATRGPHIPKIVYFGDHLICDVFASQRSGWFTGSIVEELEYEELVPESKSQDLVINWGSFFMDENGVSNPIKQANNKTYWSKFNDDHSNVTISCLSKVSVGDGISLTLKY